MSFLIAEPNGQGDPNLAGRRRLADDIESATDVAGEIDGQVYALEPVEENAFPPVPAITVYERFPDDPITANRVKSSFFDRVARRYGTAYPEAMPDPEDVEPTPVSSQAGLASIRRGYFR